MPLSLRTGTTTPPPADPFQPPAPVATDGGLDPRAEEFPDDHLAWELLLALVLWGVLCEDPPGSGPFTDLFGLLDALRCGGAMLVTEGNGLRLAPRYSPLLPFELIDDQGEGTGEIGYAFGATAWAKPSDWSRERTALLPFTALLRRFLLKVSALVREKETTP